MAKKKKKKDDKNKVSNNVRIENRKARHDYEILETFEAGIELRGPEVKSLRQGQASLKEVYATPQGSEIVLKNMHIKPYEQASEAVDPYRDRKLLLHRREINRMLGAATQKGLTIVPLRLYFNERGFAKVSVGLARGKKTHDKRADIKERDMEREMRRELKFQ